MPGSCEVCSSEPSKYRCPTCALMRYETRLAAAGLYLCKLSNRAALFSCSLACSQSHKIYCAPKATPTNEEPTDNSAAAAAAAATQSPLQNGDIAPDAARDMATKRSPSAPAVIAASPELQELLSRYPQLRSQLHDIYQATQEEEWQEWYNPPTRGRPYGRGGRGSSRRSRGPWTAEKGFNRGLGKVRKLRQDYEEGSETGVSVEAFMEFLALVNKAQTPQ
ncbi:uncharacterized protein N7482_008204 [Penicillium canariense]|uniref:HIT-type domain-containing protein n=1 Tax=Penicillium canariense TaxID=189055 RepID=A0A9W9HVB3_9EURO|nr:uncharacterized protein N7482_008204 [Penicillium canariense]KAJ5157104.1 hypothetical protein N7482_008204 [Penicillium canariense]